MEQKKEKIELQAGTLYEMNQNLVDQEKEMSNSAIRELINKVSVWFANHEGKYFMLLNNDQHDYTIFHRVAHGSGVATTECIGCLTDRGGLVSGEIQPDGNWEFWIHTPEGSLVYYLFDYTNAVIEC